jgi:hypothetical protein
MVVPHARLAAVDDTTRSMAPAACRGPLHFLFDGLYVSAICVMYKQRLDQL